MVFDPWMPDFANLFMISRWIKNVTSAVYRKIDFFLVFVFRLVLKSK